MREQISLGEFVKLLAALLHKQNVQMPFMNDEPWHLLFYHLTKSDTPQKPQFFKHIRFDWDGPYPKSQQLSEFLQALHWTASVSASNPHYETISLPDELAAIWFNQFQTLNDETQQFLNLAAKSAQQEFVETVNKYSSSI